MAQKEPDPILPLSLIHDDPIRRFEQDWLELKNWARVIASVALGTEGPFTIGVFGQWGEGKTSILQMAQKMVDESEKAKAGAITTVAFNAWQYEQERTPLIPLVASILQALERNQTDRFDKFRDALRSILYGLSVKFAAKNPLVGEAGVALDSAKATERYEELRSQWIDHQINQCLYYNAFQAIEEAQRGAEQQNLHKIVVFIDDLDRCFPNKAIRLLESIKLVLAQKGFIFVLAVDRRILESYLDQRYKKIFGLDDYRQGQSYLDKIIQLPLWIPPHRQRFGSLVADLLKRYPLEDRPSDLEYLTETIGFACNHNPRQLIRFFNDLLVDKQIFDYTNVDQKKFFPHDAFIVSRGLRLQSELTYQWLIENQEACNRFKDAEDVESLRGLIEDRLKQTDQEVEQHFLREILYHGSILRLLASKPGNEWLSSKAKRLTVHNFLDEKRESDQWVQEQIEGALLHISSEDEKEIMSGLHVLYAYPKASKAVERLTQLTERRNKNISGLAEDVLQRMKALETQL